MSLTRPKLSILLLATLATAAGINHFVHPGTYQRIMPPYLPAPVLLVAISGIAEIAGGLGMLIPTLRRPAGLGLVVLLLAVFPANVHMALHPGTFANIPAWLLWLRLPLQPMLMWWVWRSAVRPRYNAINRTQTTPASRED